MSSATDKNKQWRMESLMESLRSKSNSKTFMELAKTTRMNLLEKKYNIDPVEKQTLQTALDNLQNNITIKNKNQLVERLEMITRRQLSLKFMENTNTNSIFISSDMFYLEILLDSLTGAVNDVKVHHECLPESASEPYLVEVLKKNDFVDFTQQLEGFQSIYQLNCESKIKSKALQTLQAIENDLINVYNIESIQHNSPEMMLLSSSVGLLTKRRGGHPLKLTFFVRANDLLNLELKRMDTLHDAIQNAENAKRCIGDSVTINLEAAAPSNKLQICPLLIKSGKSDGNFGFQPISSANSTMLPATYVMCFNKSFPIATSTIDEIKRITNLGVFEETTRATTVKIENSTIDFNKEQPKTSLLNLIINVESQGVHNSSQKGLFVSLADQSHCYFISDPDLAGTSVKTIQFTEPSHVIKIIKLLRSQALFNALIASCVRQNSKQDLESSYMFEVNIVSLHFIQIFIEHPLKETMITVELDITDVRQVNCKINGSDIQADTKLENYVQRILQKTNSIPMVTRSLIKHWESEALELRGQKRLYNSDIYGVSDKGGSNSSNNNNNGGNGGGSGSEKKDEQRDENSHGNDDSYGKDSASFDICGINKNEIFFKTGGSSSSSSSTGGGGIGGGEKRLRPDDNDIDIFDQRNNKISRMMGYDLDDESEEIILPERNLLSDDLLHNENSSISPISSTASSEGSSTKKSSLMHAKSGSTPTQKSMDVFEFNDPSPPHQLPIQSPKRIPTPRESPSGGSNSNSGSVFNQEKRIHDIEIIPLKNQRNAPSPCSMEASSSPTAAVATSSTMMSGQSSITITPINNAHFFYKGSEKKSPASEEKSKSEKKKKRKREDGIDMGSPALVKKKSSDSLVTTSPSSKKSPSGNQLMGKPQTTNFKPMKSPLSDAMMLDASSSPKIKHKHPEFSESIDELAFLNNFDQQQQQQQNLLQKNLLASQQAQALSRKSGGSLNTIIDKLKSEMDSGSAPPTEKKGEYQIKSSGTSSDGIKITFNKTKKASSSSESKSPKYTGLKQGVASGPFSKKSQLSKSSSSSSSSSAQKLLFQKSSSSSSLPSSSTSIPSPKSTSCGAKSSSVKKETSSMSPFYSGNSSSSNDMLKNMLNLPSQTPRVDLMKAFDKKFQIPKLSGRSKNDERTTTDDQSSHPRSAPTTPSHALTPSPTLEYRDNNQYPTMGQKFFSNIQQQQQKFIEQQQRQQKKLFKSASSEQIYENQDSNQRISPIDSFRPSDADFQAFLRAQSKSNNDMSMNLMDTISAGNNQQQQQQQVASNLFNDGDDGLNLDHFIGSDL